MVNPHSISVVVSVLNNAHKIERCIRSFACQTYRNRELIVIDGGSSDGTIEVIERNSEHIAYWQSEPDRGIYDAWNKALAHAQGEWVCFLGADDQFFDESVLERLAATMGQAYPEHRIVYGRLAIENSEGETLSIIGEPWSTARHQFRHFMSLPHPGLMHHRSVFADHGNFDESFRISGDYEFLLRELKGRNALFAPDTITARMETGGISSNPANQLAALKEARRAQKTHGIGYPSFRWIRLVLRARTLLMFWRLLGERRAKSVLDKARSIRGKSAYWQRI